ncbi:hypothetical protein JOF53_000106 [Crossiella equi]|uniref:Uncharacterized protein n=1 Tax=Crossiella equi TaxID=130796 RepID=A0ABS5A4S2_9PSEU|nr:hypothetical protein [Crossiella equi]MBP2471234.1 hypothetical protein [Crossiella equi]
MTHKQKTTIQPEEAPGGGQPLAAGPGVGLVGHDGGRRTADAHSVVLPDGRKLAYYEFGAPDGVPCVYSPGSPASGLVGGVRWVLVDKPGFGGSDYDPRRSLPRFAKDIGHPADRLGWWW